MLKCPIQSCGRQFEDQLTMLQHVKRRHPLQSQKIKQKTTQQLIQKQQKITQQMNKLPKMNRLIQMSKQKKPLEFQRRSTSKKNKELINTIEANTIKVSEIINQSRQIVKEEENNTSNNNNNSSRKILRRASSSKINNSEESNNNMSSINLNSNNDKLPSIIKGKRLKLQSLKQSSMLQKSMNSTQLPKEKVLLKKSSLVQIQTQNQTQMYSTAPNFNKQSLSSKIQSIRSRSKGKNKDLLNSNRSQNQLNTNENKKQASQLQTPTQISIQSSIELKPSIQSQKVFQDKQKLKLQRPIKRIVQKSLKKDAIIQKKSSIIQQQLSQSVYIQKPTSANTEKGLKRFSFDKSSLITGGNNSNINNSNLIGSKFVKKQPSVNKIIINNNNNNSNNKTTQILSEQNWKQRTITIRNKNIQQFSIPDDAQVQYLFAINCQIRSINLNQCYSLISLTLNNNKISSLLFLQQTFNGGYQNLQQIYLDHNELQSLDSLPLYLKLKKISLSFNKISNIQNVLKILIRFNCLQELDFSFNPIRKQNNYKEKIVSGCKNLKKLDGIVVTKFDRELAMEYQRICYEKNGVIPLNNNNNNNNINGSPSRSDQKYRPNTAVSTNYMQSEQNCSYFDNFNNQNNIININNDPIQHYLSQKQLNQQIQILQKMIKSTKQQFEIIKQQNTTLNQQIQQYQIQLKKLTISSQQIDNPKLYKKLLNQVQELEMLNFLQYASEKQLEELLMKKIKQSGFGIELLQAN